MSSEVVEPPPPEILPAKSEDKLEIEKEEQENKEKEEQENKEKEEQESKEKKEEETKKEDNADKEGENNKDDEESKSGDEVKQVTDTETSEKDEANSDQKDPAKDEKKKFSLPKVNIKTPKVILDIRAKSKERKKKKDDSKEKEGEGSAEGEKEEGEGADENKEETTGETSAKQEDEEEASSATKDAKARVKEALDNIKIPKIHKPAFLKKNKNEKSTDKEEGEEKKDETKEEGEEGTKDEADSKAQEDEKETEKDAEDASAEEGEKKEGDKGEEDKPKAAESMDKLKESIEETKKSLACTFKNINIRKSKLFGKKKEGEGAQAGEGEEGKEGAADEKEKLLDSAEKGEGDEADADVEGGEVKTVKEGKGALILKTLRHAASGVPAMFKDVESIHEEDIELGQDLLDKGEKSETKEDLQEINLEDAKEAENKEEKEDKQSISSEKKDPEKGDEEKEGKEEADGEEKKDKDPELGGPPPTKKKKNKCHIFHQRFKNLDDQQKLGVIGCLLGVFLFFIIIISIIAAASSPSGWSDHHRYVEDGKYITTNTGCGEVWGHVDGDNMFSFRAIPYSVQVGRFEHSRIPATLEECGDSVRISENKTVFCARREYTQKVVGDEDCLLLDIYTPTVMYDAAKPVVVYLPGDDLTVLPTSQLAKDMDVVFVVAHVRQGILGFLAHSALSEDVYPKTSGNYALGDLITALKWIKTNVGHFGGDVGSVTVLGHRQGASLATVLTGVRSADGLYHRVWATGGAGRFSNYTLSEATDLWTPVVENICSGGQDIKDCLLDTDVTTLLQAVDLDWEVWAQSYGEVPKAGATEPQGMLTVDTVLLDRPLSKALKEDGLAVPLILGGDAQGEAQQDSHQFLVWDDEVQYTEHIEGSLGSWNIDLPGMVLERYNSSNNWLDYMSIVSDIRTVCPLAALSADIPAPMYLTTKPRDNGDLGSIADKSADLAAILSSPASNDDIFHTNMRGMFYDFVRHDTSFEGIRLVGDKVNSVESLENCEFWSEAEPQMVPNYGKIF